MKKAIPNAFANGIEGFGVNPIVLTIKKYFTMLFHTLNHETNNHHLPTKTFACAMAASLSIMSRRNIGYREGILRLSFMIFSKFFSM